MAKWVPQLPNKLLLLVTFSGCQLRTDRGVICEGAVGLDAAEKFMYLDAMHSE